MTSTTVLAATPPLRVAGSNGPHARVAGACYLLTFLASIPALYLIGPVLDRTDYVLGAGADTRVLAGCFLDLVNAAACVGTAVALFPVVRRHGRAARSASSPRGCSRRR